ncbi:hypothetical protein [Neobacillus sp. YIM B06451]|uniref:hypothetical protein n=1 Tax=Neobacillus sp. YIM B06451 TaxID=3070994 RepID=UPI00292D2A46|nr:hypothetical protein [Neobacillus sp. YIM B06451]
MYVIVDFIKNLFLDMWAMVKGFLYGILLFSVLILLGGALLYGFLYLKNVVF